jgi:ATPase subunit of ABC transporter with duplicated ATPase domains
VGKTTILRSLIGSAPGMTDENFAIDSGVVEWGHEVQVGYFAQDHRATILPGSTVFDWLQQFDPTAGNEELRGLLGQMLFKSDEGLKPTEALSGGEAARLIFCRLMLQKPNVLLLDEPTNHLDLESINALNIALQKYQGTLFLVTHDHDLLEETATRIWRVSARGIEDFKGAYEELQSVGA